MKLLKTGGVTPACEALKAARKAGLKTMIGCMIETSILISAAAHLAELTDHLDIDGNLLITNDPYCRRRRRSRESSPLPPRRRKRGCGSRPEERDPFSLIDGRTFQAGDAFFQGGWLAKSAAKPPDLPEILRA